MINASNINYCTARTLDGIFVYVELTTAQCMGAGDACRDERIIAFEDRNGQIVPHDVRLGSLTDVAPELQSSPQPRKRGFM